MARTGVTFSEVEEATRYLQGTGRTPTVDAIRERLGTGSRTTLLAHLNRWKALNTEGNSSSLPEPLLALVKGLWESLSASAEERVAEEKTLAEETVSVVKAELRTTQQNTNELQRTVHELQEKYDAEHRAKNALGTELLNTQQTHEKLNTLHQATLKQLEEAKAENGRLHKLATQIQANLEHYQQSIEQQQLQHTLAKEKQQALHAEEIKQLKTLLLEAQTRYEQSEKALSTAQFHEQQTQKDYDTLLTIHEKMKIKQQENERLCAELQVRTQYQQTQADKHEQALVNERNLTQSLQQQVAVLTQQVQRAQTDLQQAQNKIETLREEKQFLAQEKASLEGALKAWQSKK